MAPGRGDARYLVESGTTDAQVARLLDLLGVDDAGERARVATSAARLEHTDELDGLVAEWIADKTADTVLERLPRGRIPSPSETSGEDESHRARGDGTSPSLAPHRRMWRRRQMGPQITKRWLPALS